MESHFLTQCDGLSFPNNIHNAQFYSPPPMFNVPPPPIPFHRPPPFSQPSLVCRPPPPVPSMRCAPPPLFQPSPYPVVPHAYIQSRSKYLNCEPRIAKEQLSFTDRDINSSVTTSSIRLRVPQEQDEPGIPESIDVSLSSDVNRTHDSTIISGIKMTTISPSHPLNDNVISFKRDQAMVDKWLKQLTLKKQEKLDLNCDNETSPKNLNINEPVSLGQVHAIVAQYQSLLRDLEQFSHTSRDRATNSSADVDSITNAPTNKIDDAKKKLSELSQVLSADSFRCGVVRAVAARRRKRARQRVATRRRSVARTELHRLLDEKMRQAARQHQQANKVWAQISKTFYYYLS